MGRVKVSPRGISGGQSGNRTHFSPKISASAPFPFIYLSIHLSNTATTESSHLRPLLNNCHHVNC